MGEECRFKSRNSKYCDMAVHHLLSPREYWEDKGKLAKKFRELQTMKIWMHMCRHREYHDNNDYFIDLPDPEVVHEAVIATRKLRRINSYFNNVSYWDEVKRKYILVPERIAKVKTLERNSRANYLRQLATVGEITIIPESIVTGALLLAAPQVAQERLRQGTGYVLPGFFKQGVPTSEARRTALQVLNSELAAA